MKTNKLFQPRSLLGAALGLMLLLPASLHAVTVIYTNSGTFTPPVGVTSITVECWGGGGAGGGSFVTPAGSTNSGGGGGGGGAYARLNTVPVTPGTPYTITIPAAATCPASGFANGQTYDGSAVSFTGDGAVTVTANGGLGGGSSVVTGTTAISGAAGAGGAAGTGLDGAFKGGNATFWSSGNGGGGGGGAGDLGVGGNSSASNGTFGAGGTGSDADHTGGDGGASRNGAGSGNAASSPGGGGGGAKSTSTSKTSRAGGAGGKGRIIISYTLPVVKDNNTDVLTNTTSWVGGVVPNADSVAIWDNTVTSANTTDLGADMTWAGLKVANPSGLVTINGTNTLTLGAALTDIDMTTATANLTLNCNLALGAANDWNVTTGQTLTVNGAVSGANNLTKLGAGTVTLNGADSYSARVYVKDGTLNLAGPKTGIVNSVNVADTAGTDATINITGNLAIAAGQEFRIGMASTTPVTGTVNQSGGAVSFGTSGNQLLLGATANVANTGIYNLSGGTLTIPAVANRGIILGVNYGNTGIFNLSASGALDMAGSIQIGRSESGSNNTNTTGIFNQTGGTAAIGDLRMGGSVANNEGSSGTLNLSAGTFVATNFSALSGTINGTSTINISNAADVTLPAFPTTRGSGATATITFNGGTLRNYAPSANYMSNLTAAYIKAGGARFNTDKGSITVAQPLETDLVSLGGGLTKEGTNTLTLSGAPTYTGPTLVSAGKLVVPSTSSTTNVVTVSANAALGVTASGTSQWQPASLTLPNPCALEFNSVQNPSTTTAPILPTAAVGAVANVTITINSISGAVTPGNSYPLLGNMNGTTNGYTLGTQPVGVTGHLGVTGTTLVYVVDSSADLWTGADVTNPTWWDIATTANWDGKAMLNTPTGTYTDGDVVLFDDSAAPASPVTVDIQTAVAPSNMIFANSAKGYLVTNSSGTSGIGGSGSLTTTGSGTLTLASSNSYSGGTINSGAGGIITVNNANALGTGPFTFNGGRRLTVSTGLDVTNAIVIGVNSGNSSQGIIEAGSAAGTATVSGPIQINNGAVAGGHFAARTAGTVLDVKGVITASVPVTQRIGPGTVKFSGGGTGYANLTVAQDTAQVGAVNGIATSATVSIGNSGTATLDLNGYDQTLVGIAKGANAATITNSSATPVTLTLTGTSSYGGTIKDDGSTGKIGLTVAGGDLTLSGANTHSGSTLVNAGTLNVSNNLALQNSALITTGAGTLTIGAGITTPTIGGLSGASGDLATIISSGYGNVTDLTLNPVSGTVTYGGVIADGAAGMTLTKSGAGTQVLNGASTFTGNLLVSAGTVQLGADDRLSPSAGLELAPNGTTTAILDLNGYDQTLSRLVFTATNAAGNLTITGGANSKLTINATSNTELGAGGAITAFRDVTTDLSGLGEFIWSGPANAFRVGLRFGVANTANPGTSTTTLAEKNTITATTLGVGIQGASNHGGTNVLHLGQTNILNVNSLLVGTAGRSFATLDFRTGLINPTVKIRGTNAPNDATARVTTWDVGNVIHFGNSTWAATNDFSAGELDARVISLRIGRADALNQTGRAGIENAGFIMGKGTLDVTTLIIGQYAGVAGSGLGATANYGGNGSFDLNDAAGMVTAEDVILADNIGLATNGVTKTTSGTFNLNAGTVEAKTIDKGADSGNATSVTRNFNFSGGTVRNYPGFNLAIANVPLNLTGSGPRNFEATAGQTITVAASSVISGSGQGFTKQGAGTLALSGVNTYTGPTIISAGTLLVNSPGSIDAASAVTVNTNATLGGTGTINGSVTVADGGNLAPGASPGTLSIGGNLDISAQAAGTTGKLRYELDTLAGTNDLIAVGGTLTIGAGVLGFSDFAFSNLGGLQAGTYKLITSGGISGTLAGGGTNGTIGSFNASLQLNGNDLELVVTGGSGAPSPTLLTNSVSGSTLSLSWPAGQGWKLQQQTNALSKGLGTNWVDVTPGSASSTNIPLNKITPATFYRLVYP